MTKRLTGMRAATTLMDLGSSSIAAGVIARRRPVVRLLERELLPFAHSFAPPIWLDGTARRYPQLVPFSAGPAECPGR